jgi:hypothetical protein
MINALSVYKEKLANAKNSLDYKSAFAGLVQSLSLQELNIDDVDISQYESTINELWSNTPIATLEDTKNNKDGSTTTTTRPLFKRPDISLSNISVLRDRLGVISQKQEAQKIKKEMIDMLSNQPEADRQKVGESLKAILFNSKINNTYSNIKKILNWVNQVKNFGTNTHNKSLFYMSHQVDGEMKGGNGKSWIIDALREALNEINIPNCSRTLPTWHDSEITSDFANNVVSFAEEQSFCLPHSPTYDIMDKSNYQTRIKYQPSTVMKSICNIIGSTNEPLTKADQTLRRRLDIIYCNENQVIDELSTEQKSMIPTRLQQIQAWKYLLTHNISIDMYPTATDKVNTISNEERNILWELVNWKDDWGDIYNSSNEIAVRTFKDVCDRSGKKISYSAAVPLAKKYGAVITKKGSHGRETEGSSMIDLSNMEIPTNIFEDDSEFTLPEVYKLIDAEYKPTEPTEPTDDKITDDELSELLNEIDGLSTNDEPDTDTMELFDTINEPDISYKDVYMTTPTNKENDQFEVVNPLFSSNCTRSDTNTSSRRNFVFECDEIGLDEQKELVRTLVSSNVINRAVYSGGKSIHCRITINYEPESKEEYKYIFSYLNDKYFGNNADKSCSNPARLTRKPNGIRSNGKKQLLVYKSSKVLDVAFLHKEYKKIQNKRQIDRQMKAMLYDLGYKPKKYDTISETLEHMKNQHSDGYNATIACLDGNGTYEEGMRALNYCKWLGFTYDEIIKEIDFGSWNFREELYDNIGEN